MPVVCPSPLWSPFLRGVALVALALPPVSAFGQITRVPNTTLAMPQNPQTFGYTTEDAFAGVTFTQPVAMATPPGETNRLFVVEKGGRIWVINDLNNAAGSRVLFMDIVSRTLPSGEMGLLGLAFHPDFATNRYFYVYYNTTATTNRPSGGTNTGRHDRVSRFTAPPASTPTAQVDLATEVPLISQWDEADNHNGGDVHFGPDGYLYISLGDEGGGNDQFNNSQRINQDYFAGLLRIDVDRRPGNPAPNAHPAVHPGTYSVPADNPWVGATSFNGTAVDPATVRTEFWAVGLRNPWRFSFDRPTGRLFLADVGQSAREEVNLITGGGNYGWSYREGRIAGPRANPPAGVTFVDPIHDYPRSDGGSISGGVIYRGSRFASLQGQYIFGDYSSGNIWALAIPATGTATAVRLTGESSPVAFGHDPRNGDILIASIGTGRLRRLVHNTTPTGSALPTTLSTTGAFSNLATLAPNAGIVAYEPNVPFWSDNAIKRRWFSIPNTADQMTFSADGNWSFPAGTVWIKHFDLEMTRGDAASARRVETRFLVRNSTGVYGATYRWNDQQTEATLVADAGEERDYTINDGGVNRTQRWRFPSRAECLQCHTTVGGHALSFTTAQLNRTVTYSSGAANQLTALANAGYFNAAIPSPSTLRALSAAGDTTASLEHRVRSYLAANCVQCHQPGGAAQGNWDARIATPTAGANLIDGALVNNGGDANNRVIAPGSTARSMLLSRINVRGATQMPPLGSNVVDAGAVSLVTAWINELGAPAFAAQPPVSQSAGAGSTVSISVIATGASNPTYQWRRNGVNLVNGGNVAGATSPTLTLTNVSAGDAANYSVVVTNASGSSTSNGSTLTLTAAAPTFAPVIVTQPQTQTVIGGASVTFNVGATGTGPLTYQWRYNGAVIAGATGASHTLSNVQLSNAGSYAVTVVNAHGSAQSASATLTINTSSVYYVGITGDSAGNLYITDAARNLVRVIGGGLVRTRAGQAGVAGSANGSGTSATFNQPYGVAIDTAGNLYVADTGNAIVRHVTSAGTVTTLAGNPAARGNVDATGSSAQFSHPLGIAVDAAGVNFVADGFTNTIRRISSAAAVTTLAGQNGTRGDTDATGAAARFNHPASIAVAPNGNLYVADAFNHLIRQITPAGVVTTVAGLSGVSGYANGTGAAAQFNQPRGIAIDPAGVLYVSDTGNSVIRRVTTAGVVTTLAGLPGVAGNQDGPGTSAQFNQPHGLWVDGSGNVFVADTGNNAIRRVASNGATTTVTFAEVTPDPPAPAPTPTPTPTPPAPAPTSGGGGGAIGHGLVGLLAGFGVLRVVRRRRGCERR